MLTELFEDYLDAGGDWLRSTVVRTATSTTARDVLSNDQYTRFCDLVKKEGLANAELIRSEKRRLQRELDANPNSQEAPWILCHPDLPGREELPNPKPSPKRPQLKGLKPQP